ncbi:UDP-N-acetylmuramate dehydrogenase [Carboxylicivirga sp. M1479]|uniref:UDP-N-acetylmuramate dehydrogenase n=1 Tax=Carboxylicivirga sp. M1479 TaxID=2594476 RepID=UPI0011774A7A|nr:UDP-N-acetylmuramate dehydrogenase [Carboxylicivirga sp. M1479]TRX63257.1 UDP-N-acetylmuramate dehydrogenase [Carboxylicivirga sp. M1479]
MNNIAHNIGLKPYNTFGFNTIAKELITCTNIESVKEALHYLQSNAQPYLILGGGSNLLFSQDFNGLLIHPLLKQMHITDETDQFVYLEAGAGVVWDDLVKYCVEKNWYGLENLSYIPGHVGASPVQNIGAYGVEAKDCITSVKGYFIDRVEPFELSNQECQFAYRQSIFKGKLKNKTLITSVVFKLSKKEHFTLNYGPVKQQVESNGPITLKNVRETITNIRKSKLPEPEVLGNAGSFFKNPIIKLDAYETLKKQYEQIPHYPIDAEHVKVPAGWLIEQAGWKGKAMGDAAVHDKQALVLINKGNASGNDVIQLSKCIINDISKKFNITIEPEVNII